MDLIKTAPNEKLPFVLITGVTYENCNENGFPEGNEFNKLYAISEKVDQNVIGLTESEFVGTFTHQCERLDYFYIKDTSQVRKELTQLYSDQFSDYKYYISIYPDKTWDAYLTFLYPNEEIQEFMANQKVIARLQEAGDNLDKARQVDHWIYFSDKSARESFIQYILEKGYKVEEEQTLKDPELRYMLRISRVDFVYASAISEITLDLKRAAAEHSGEYDGWETFVVKK